MLDVSLFLTEKYNVTFVTGREVRYKGRLEGSIAEQHISDGSLELESGNIAIDTLNYGLIKLVIENNADPKMVEGHLEYWVMVNVSSDVFIDLLLEHSDFISNAVIERILFYYGDSEFYNGELSNKLFQIIKSRCKAIAEEPIRQKLLKRIFDLA